LWSDTVPLCQECLHDRRLVVPRLIPYLAHTLPAGSKLLLLEVGDRELLEVALHRLG
jgi:hypothetical protein